MTGAGGGAERGDAGADTITEPHDCVLVFSNRDIDVHSIQRNHIQDTIYYKWLKYEDDIRNYSI